MANVVPFPLMPPKSTELRLEHFDENVYTADSSTVLYKFLDALCGDGGVGNLKKELLVQRLSAAMDGIYGSALDYIFGGVRFLSRISSEAYSFNAEAGSLTSDQWDEVTTKDAAYRNRIREFFIAAGAGNTAEGVRQAVHAATSADCQVMESWRYIDCADEETEILTRSGYKHYSDLEEGEEVLTLNMSSGLAEWQAPTKINVFPVVDHEMLSVEMSGRHSSLTTMNHRWPVSSRVKRSDGSRGYSDIRIRASSELATEDRFIRSAPVTGLPETAKLADSLVELVAWFVTEGHIHAQTSVVTIVQSHAVNPTKVDSIRAALTALIGPAVEVFDRTGPRADQQPAWREWASESKPDITVFRLNSAAGRLLIAQAPEKVASMDFIQSLTRSQLQLFLDTCIAADGHVRKDGYRSFVQKSMERTVPVQIAATLLGIPTSIQEGSGACHVLSLCEREKFVQPLGQSRKNAESVRYTGTVWCPTTPNGTWFARRRGTTYFTGNSFGLTAGVGRALITAYAAVELATGHRVYFTGQTAAEAKSDATAFVGSQPVPADWAVEQVRPRNEITVVPHKGTYSPREARVLREMLDKITPQDTVVTVNRNGLAVNTPVVLRAIAADSTYYQVEKVVDPAPDLASLPAPEMLAIDLDPSERWLFERSRELAPYARFNITQEYGYYYLVSGGARSPIDTVQYGTLQDDGSVAPETTFEWYEQTEEYGPWTSYETTSNPAYASQADYVAARKAEVIALGGQADDYQYRLPVQKPASFKRAYTADLAIASVAPTRESTVTSSWTSRRQRGVFTELRNTARFNKK